eukprot:Tbor_TRINITY_DN4555_c0_g1::TRINITY_DN4555_c0_g1_i1::g.15780::m.15780/K01611/speD, AMD1; S-adenosylmethionine decarboxylase
MSEQTTPPCVVTMMASLGPIAKRKQSITTDDGNIQKDGFEGPEKRLELIIRLSDSSPANGLRSLDVTVWKAVVSVLNAQIVSTLSNSEMDAYVLTESSLFVMDSRVILITCGTTTLLEAVPVLLDVISNIQGCVEWMSFMRKNFSYPWEQRGPHVSIKKEYETLKKYFPSGKPYIFGPIESDHYFFFCYDDIRRPTIESDTQMSMTMYGLDKEMSEHFFSKEFYSTGKETEEIRKVTRLSDILDGWQCQDLQFAPCGYSVNAVRDYEYQTMHITPEEHCSFASYETNSRVTNLAERMNTVLGVFSPERFTILILIDPESPIGVAYKENREIGIEAHYHPKYSMLNRTVNEFTPGYVMVNVNYVKLGSSNSNSNSSDK